MRLAWSVVVVLVVASAATAPAAAEPTDDVVIPPPVSGRGLDDVTPSDNLARARLIEDHLEVSRRFVGRPKPPPPLFRVISARPRHVLYQAYNLRRLANLLSFEQLRTAPDLAPLQVDATPADVFEQLNWTLRVVLRVRRHLGLEATVPERVQPEDTTAMQVFVAIAEAGRMVNTLLDQQTTSTDVFRGLSTMLHVAMALHAKQTKAFLPKPPKFEPNKTPRDVYERMMACYALIHRIGRAQDVHTLELEPRALGDRSIRPDDVTSLLTVVLSELTFVYSKVQREEPELVFYWIERRYPAHSFQRAGHLQRILQSLADAMGAG